MLPLLFSVLWCGAECFLFVHGDLWLSTCIFYTWRSSAKRVVSTVVVLLLILLCIDRCTRGLHNVRCDILQLQQHIHIFYFRKRKKISLCTLFSFVKISTFSAYPCTPSPFDKINLSTLLGCLSNSNMSSSSSSFNSRKQMSVTDFSFVAGCSRWTRAPSDLTTSFCLSRRRKHHHQVKSGTSLTGRILRRCALWRLHYDQQHTFTKPWGSRNRL